MKYRNITNKNRCIYLNVNNLICSVDKGVFRQSDGQENFLDGYKTSKTRVCVTVGMMTTGYDCQDILNLCLMRPIFSPTDFIQIKGRGTRKFTFRHFARYPDGRKEEVNEEKKLFKLFYFFGNFEYFEEKYNYDEVLKLPLKRPSIVIGPEPPVVHEDYESLLPDPLKVITEKAIGAEGMKIDRMFFEKFEEKVKSDTTVRSYVEQDNWDAAIGYLMTELMNKPEEFFTIDKIRKAASVDRRLTAREILEKIFGFIPKFKSKDELLDDEFDRFVSIHKPQDSSKILAIKNFLKAYITDNEVRDIIEKKEFARLATNPIKDDFRMLDAHWRQVITEYVKDYVVLNKFLS